ncbi:MAG: sodium:solute symporter family protein [Acholeplasmataceae bacterium]|nr:sodium:solute symporter family protein [Acholeplasmataceae bacterium]
MQLSSTQFISMIIVLILASIPGLLAAKKVKSEADYSVGGRKAGSVLVAGTIIGTIVGAAATIGTAQLGYKVGISAWWFTLGSGIALVVMALFYAKPLRNSGLTTISEFLVINYGEKAGPMSSIAATAGIFLSIVASMLTAIHLIAGVFQVNLIEASAVIMVVVLLSVFLGGISGSGMAGLVKVGLIFGTIFIAGIWAYNDLGGIGGIKMTFPTTPWLSMFAGGKEKVLYNISSLIIGVISTQSYIQALFSASDSKKAAIGCIVAAVIVIPIGLPSAIIGMSVQISNPGINSIDALPIYLLHYMPDWLGGAAIAALILSALWSISGLVLGCGTMVSRDIFKAVFCLNDHRVLLWINRSFVFLITLAAEIVVFYNSDSYVLDWTYLSMALRGAGIFLPLTFAILFKNKVPARAGLLSMIAGIFVALTWKLLFPEAKDTLFPSLAFNLIFLLPGVVWAMTQENKKNKVVSKK